MCTVNCQRYVEKALTGDDIAGKRVIEVGAFDVNGTTRPYLETLGPAEYVGVDIMGGPGVDVVCGAEHLVELFGREQFDVLITTEMLEHVRDWRTVVHNMKQVIKPGGIIVITTRSPGFPMHGYPYDFWRYTPADMRAIFADFGEVDVQSDDPGEPGVFVRAVKPAAFDEIDLAGFGLHSVLHRKRALDVSPVRFRAAQAAWAAWRRVKDLLPGSLKLAIRDRLSTPRS